MARVIGVIEAPHDTKVHGMLAVVAMNSSCRRPMERWIKLEEVTYIPCPGYGPDLKFLEFFLSEEFTRVSPDLLRRWANDGYATPHDLRGFEHMDQTLREKEIERIKEIQATWSDRFKQQNDHALDKEEGIFKLPSHSDYGGIPILYSDKSGEVFCAKCATELEEMDYSFAFEEGASRHCEECGKELEAAYGDPDAEEDEQDEVRTSMQEIRRQHTLPLAGTWAGAKFSGF